MFIAFIGLVSVLIAAIMRDTMFVEIGFAFIGFDIVLELAHLNDNTVKAVNNMKPIYEMLEKIRKKLGEANDDR